MPMPKFDRLRLGKVGIAAPGRWLSFLEMALLALLMVQGARLVWAAVTPIGSFGDWRGKQAQIPSPSARQALFAAFDPFFRTSGGGGGNAVVTSLSLTLYGVRVNEGSGQGSAIIATPDGVQGSFAVGDEIMPGVILKGVSFDHVTIDRGGAEETLYLDQSNPAPTAQPGDDTPGPDPDGPPSAAPPIDAPAGGPSVSAIRSDIGFAPRIVGGKVTGMLLSPKGPAFQAAGFQQGDVVREVNGRPISSPSDLQAVQALIVPGARLSLSVERGASVVPIALILQGS
jgi:general secretion pathway protein C